MINDLVNIFSIHSSRLDIFVGFTYSTVHIYYIKPPKSMLNKKNNNNIFTQGK